MDAAVGILSIAWLLKSIISKCCICLCRLSFFKYIGKGIVWFAMKCLVPMGKKICDFFEGAWDLIVVMKSNYCPAIRYREDVEKD